MLRYFSILPIYTCLSSYLAKLNTNKNFWKWLRFAVNNRIPNIRTEAEVLRNETRFHILL